DGGGVGAVDDVVGGHLALGVDDDVDEEIVLELHVGMLHLRGDRHIGERDELGGTQQRGGNVVGIGLHGDAGEESAGGRNGERAKDVVDQDFAAILDVLPTTAPILGGLGLRGGHFN